MTYNEINVPPLIRTDRIISAFGNLIDYHKVDEYTEVLMLEMLSHDFPAIEGFPTIITEDDIEEEKMFLTGEPLEKCHIGQLAWMVTDGHHRSLAAIAANLPHFPVTLDYSCITNEKDLKQFQS